MPANGLFGLPSSARHTNAEENINTQVPENLDTQELSHLRTQESKNLDTSIPEIPSTKALKNISIKVLENSNIEELINKKNTEILKNYNIKVSKNPSTQVLKNFATGQPEVQDIQVAEGLSIKDSGYQGISALPKPQKNNRAKDDKKPARKQASVHLTGGVLKALHLYAYQEGLEKSEVVEKALRKFIPKKYFD